MTPSEAAKIITDFHKSIKDLRPNAIVQSNEELPCTSARIKYAHFVHAEELVGHAEMTEEKLQEIIESYGIVDSLFSEDPEPINIRYREYLERLKRGIVIDFRMPNPFGEVRPVIEIYNFIGECWFLKYHKNILTGNLLGSVIYEKLYDKAINESDIKSLIELVNTGLTRKVFYPKKKDSSESIFI
jgi:hypothetical protein